MIADADGRAVILPGKLMVDARRLPILIVPMERCAGQIAMSVLAADYDDSNLRQRRLADPAPGICNETVRSKLLQYALEVDSAGSPDAEGARDLAPSNISWRGLNELKNIFLC
jgi:hypothetical protein